MSFSNRTAHMQHSFVLVASLGQGPIGLWSLVKGLIEMFGAGFVFCRQGILGNYDFSVFVRNGSR